MMDATVRLLREPEEEFVTLSPTREQQIEAARLADAAAQLGRILAGSFITPQAQQRAVELHQTCTQALKRLKL